MSTQTPGLKPVAKPAAEIMCRNCKVQDVITLTARLAQLLAEEVDLLGAMKVAKIEALQAEKLFLVGALDAHRKLIDRQNPHLLSETIPSQDRGDLREVVSVFQRYSRREPPGSCCWPGEVNYKIVQAITHVVKQNAHESRL